jgi:Concanavalin A-like lectin/glucanases superfamily
MRPWLALVLLLVSVGLLWGQDISTLVPFHPGDINKDHPLAQRLVAWWVVQPQLAGGTTWYDLIGQERSTLVNMAAGFGFQPTRRPGWGGEVRFDGIDDYVLGSNNTVFDFPDVTFTVSLRYRAVKLGQTNYLIAKRGGTSGGWYLRVDSGGTLSAVVNDDANGDAAARTTTSDSHLDGNWRQVTVIFVIDTVTAANADVAIYPNGILDQGTRFSSVGAPAAICACPLTFGARSDFTQTLEGSVDDIRIWRGALPLTTIANLSVDRPPDFGGLVQPPLAPAFPSAVAGAPSRGQFFPFFY